MRNERNMRNTLGSPGTLRGSNSESQHVQNFKIICRWNCTYLDCKKYIYIYICARNTSVSTSISTAILRLDQEGHARNDARNMRGMRETRENAEHCQEVPEQCAGTTQTPGLPRGHRDPSISTRPRNGGNGCRVYVIMRPLYHPAKHRKAETT